MKEPVLFSWSGGKDSSLALHRVWQEGKYRVVALLTVLSQDYDRISHHGVRSALLEQQADSLGLPLEPVYLSVSSTNKEYEAKMGELLIRYRDRGVRSVVFGDIFLEDLRRYREEKLAQVDMKGLFPLWKEDTAALVRRFVALGFKAVLCCVNPKLLAPSFAGREIDERFIADLPPTVDPCGENGEFHSFVYQGPIFKKRIDHRIGEVVMRPGGNYFCDLLPV